MCNWLHILNENVIFGGCLTILLDVSYFKHQMVQNELVCVLDTYKIILNSFRSLQAFSSTKNDGKVLYSYSFIIIIYFN